MNHLTEAAICQFETALRDKERTAGTIAKYGKTMRELAKYLAGEVPTKEHLLGFRDTLLRTKKARSVNTDLSAINAYLEFSGHAEERLRLLKVQRQAFQPPERELREEEYRCLLNTAKKRSQRLYYVLLTLGGTGIRVSELPFITVEAVKMGSAEIRLKGRTRTVLLARELRRRLLSYAKSQGATTGLLFRTRSGKPLDRSNLYHELKRLCQAAKVNPNKVFPHNFRHLFARAFYAVERNLAHLADVLGHSSIETTRIYVAASAQDYERTINKMKLIL